MSGTKHEKWVSGAQEMVQATSRLVHERAGACSFELRYDILDRLTKPGETGTPSDSIRWTAEVMLDSPGGHVARTGTCRIDPDDQFGHGVGIQWACIRLLRALGIPVQAVDVFGRDEPAL